MYPKINQMQIVLLKKKKSNYLLHERNNVFSYLPKPNALKHESGKTRLVILGVLKCISNLVTWRLIINLRGHFCCDLKSRLQR